MVDSCQELFLSLSEAGIVKVDVDGSKELNRVPSVSRRIRLQCILCHDTVAT